MRDYQPVDAVDATAPSGGAGAAPVQTNVRDAARCPRCRLTRAFFAAIWHSKTSVLRWSVLIFPLESALSLYPIPRSEAHCRSSPLHPPLFDNGLGASSTASAHILGCTPRIRSTATFADPIPPMTSARMDPTQQWITRNASRTARPPRMSPFPIASWRCPRSYDRPLRDQEGRQRFPPNEAPNSAVCATGTPDMPLRLVVDPFDRRYAGNALTPVRMPSRPCRLSGHFRFRRGPH